MKYWIQSFLLGVPKIVVGFRTRDGKLVSISEMETHKIPETVNSRPNAQWNADMCVNFAATFLDCEFRRFCAWCRESARLTTLRRVEEHCE
jgi:RAT1-interacting protein